MHKHIYTLAPLASAYKRQWQCKCNACFCIYLRRPLCWCVWAARSGSTCSGPSHGPGPPDCQALRLPGVATVKVTVNVSPSLWLQVQVGSRARRRRTGPSDGRRAGPPSQWSPAVSPPCHRGETPVRVHLQSKQLRHFYKICQNVNVRRLVTPGRLGGKTAWDDESTRSAGAEWRSCAMAETMWYETFIITARDSSHKHTPQGVNCRTFNANVRSSWPPGPGGSEVSYLPGTVSPIIVVVETPEYRERNAVQMSGDCSPMRNGPGASPSWSKFFNVGVSLF